MARKINILKKGLRKYIFFNTNSLNIKFLPSKILTQMPSMALLKKAAERRANDWQARSSNHTHLD
jgi:hypothetical protein